MSNKTERLLIVPDSHYPYVDKKAWALMIKAAKVLKPGIIVVLGDFLDCESISRHEKDPSRRVSLKDELFAANKALDQLDALGAHTKHFCLGNHEQRLPDFIARKCPELHGFLDIPDLLKLRDRSWKVTQYNEYCRVGKVYFTHEEGNAGPQAHIKARETFEGCVVIGHTHRLASHYSSNVQGSSKVGITMGWLGDKKSIAYMHRAKTRHWQLAFGSGVMEPNGIVHLSTHPIVKYKVCIDGKIVSL